MDTLREEEDSLKVAGLVERRRTIRRQRMRSRDKRHVAPTTIERIRTIAAHPIMD
jgi:hypothetical protein